MPSKRLERLQLPLNDDELDAIDEWRFSHRMPSRAAAVRALLYLGIKSHSESNNGEPPLSGPPDSRRIGVIDVGPELKALFGTGERKRVLVVEDEFLIAAGLRALVEDAGYDVIGPASGVDDALILLEDKKPDAALLDINLGSRKVTDLTDKLSALSVPFMFCTAYDPDKLLPESLHHIPVVRKPYVQETLAKLLRRLCS